MAEDSVITAQVKSLNFDNVLQSESTPNGDLDLEGVDTAPDLVTLEEQKRQAQRYIHEQESFWSWFCCRCLCCDGYYPCYWPDCFWFGTGTGDCCAGTCTGCGECCSGCGDCVGECCSGCGECGAECCAGGDCGSCC